MKKVLLVNVCLIGDSTGTGNTLSAIFCKMKRENISQICIDFYRKDNGDDSCYLVQKSFSMVRYMLANRRKYVKTSNQLGNFRQNISGASTSDLRGIAYEVLRGVADSMPVHIGKDMDAFIKKMDPEAIYTCGCSITVLKTARKIAKKYDLPIVLHMMDNWDDTLYRSTLLCKPFVWMLRRELKLVNKLSNGNLAISEALGKKMEHEYGVPYYALMNTVDTIAEKPCCKERDKLVFMYAGSLSINRYVSLSHIAMALNDALSTNGYVFRMFVPPAQNTEEMHLNFKGCNVEFHDYVPREQLLCEYMDADVLVLAESFDDNFCEFTKYSLSTKVPEYMSMGKPILAYMSDKLYSYEYLRRSCAAKVAANHSELRQHVIELKNFRNRQQLAENGLNFVKAHHSRMHCEEMLRKVFK